MTGSMRALSLWAPVVVMMAAIFAFSANPASSEHHGLLVLLGRKAGHLTGYALLMAAMWRALHATIGGRRALAIAYVATIAYAASDEFHQTFVRGRVGTWHDVVIDAAGALIAVAVVTAFARARNRKRPMKKPAPA